MKISIAYKCSNCGYKSSKWQGKCTTCQMWNSFVEVEETNISNKNNNQHHVLKKENDVVLLHEVKNENKIRLHCSDTELSRVLGGGIVEGSLILIGGEPGIGKSTMMLQLVLQSPKYKFLYISGEENIPQIKLRADRINKSQKNCFILNEMNLEKIFECSEKVNPKIIIIDSIQTIYSSSVDLQYNSITQIKACTSLLLQFAKQKNIAIFIIGHITKEGFIAGPKLLEHMVDVVLQFEGERQSSCRILRSIKNRFGPTTEIGIYKMEHNGLKEVTNPSEIFLSRNKLQSSGIVVGVIQEGNRSFFIEVQALVTKSFYGMSQRTAIGFDSKRLSMLIAVLEKKASFKLSDKDIFLNIVGGLKISDPALDLPVCIAIISSFLEIQIPSNICFSAEIGLNGELRAVKKAFQRINEASKLGFKTIITSETNENISSCKDITIKTYDSMIDVTKDLKKKN